MTTSEKVFVVTNKGNVGSALMDLESSGIIIINRITQINAELVEGGGSLEGIVLSSKAWNKLINDPEIIARSGSELDEDTGKQVISKPSVGWKLPERFKPSFSCTLKAIPWVVFHVDDSPSLQRDNSNA